MALIRSGQSIRILEYETKAIFKQFDIPILAGVVITQPDEISKKLQKLTYPTIIKSQIAIGSRKKAGLIQIAKTQREESRYVNNFSTL